MVIVDLPIPAGFAAEREDLEKLVAEEAVAKYQLTPRSAIFTCGNYGPTNRWCCTTACGQRCR